MSAKTLNVLFVCTGNSARSIMAEALLAHFGGDHFKAFSAGSQPKGEVNPLALSTIKQLRISTDGLRSKSWDEFAQPGAPALDFVLTVCDSAAGEACPVWPGQPVTAQWGIPDPAAVSGSEEVKAKAFLDAATLLKRRIQLMLNLPLGRLERMSLQREIDRIGQIKA